MYFPENNLEGLEKRNLAAREGSATAILKTNENHFFFKIAHGR